MRQVLQGSDSCHTLALLEYMFNAGTALCVADPGLAEEVETVVSEGEGYEAGTGSPGVTVASRIRDAMGSLSAKEKQVARSILAEYPISGLESSAALAAAAKVSVPTVVRFIARLGYPSYKAFQGTLRSEIAEKTASPVVLEERHFRSSVRERASQTAAEVISEVVRRTFLGLPDSEVEAAVSVLAKIDGQVHTFGGRFSHILAEYAALNLRQLRPRVQFHRDNHDAIAAAMDATRRDTLLVFDVRRYQPTTIELARLFKERRGHVILITDPWMSPIAEFADVVLPARVEAPSPMDGLVGPMAVVETLAAGVHALLDARSAERLVDWETASNLLEGRSSP